MLFKTGNVCQKVDAKKQMLYTVCQNTHAKNQMLKKCKHDLSSNQNTQRKSWNIKMECFSSLLVTINTEVIELKSNLELTHLCRLDEWQLSATI